MRIYIIFTFIYIIHFYLYNILSFFKLQYFIYTPS